MKESKNKSRSGRVGLPLVDRTAAEDNKSKRAARARARRRRRETTWVGAWGVAPPINCPGRADFGLHRIQPLTSVCVCGGMDGPMAAEDRRAEEANGHVAATRRKAPKPTMGGGYEATATRIPHHKPTKPKTKQNRKASRAEPGPARADGQTSDLIRFRSVPLPHPRVRSHGAPSSQAGNQPRRPQHPVPTPALPGSLLASTLRHVDTSTTLDCDSCYSSPAAAVPCRPGRTRIAEQKRAAAGGQRRTLALHLPVSPSPSPSAPRAAPGDGRHRPTLEDSADEPRGARALARFRVDCRGPLGSRHTRARETNKKNIG